MPRFESWQSCEFSIIREGQAAKIHTLIRAVSYSDALETALVFGAGRQPVGTTDPLYRPGDMSLTFLVRWWRVFTREATEGGTINLGDLDFHMALKRQPRGVPDPVVDEIDFQIVGAEDDGTAETPDALVTVVPCLPTNILRNGVHL